MDESKGEKGSMWEPTNVTNLLKNAKSGTYYARLKIRGKQKWRTLKTKVFSVAKLRLADVEKEERGRAQEIGDVHLAEGETVLGPYIRQFLEQTNSTKRGQKALGPATRARREIAVKALLKTWPGLDTLDARRITKADCEAWAKRAVTEGTGFVAPGAKTTRKGMSPSAFNKCVDALRAILEFAKQKGLQHKNPAGGIAKLQLSKKSLSKLPNETQFSALVRSISEAGARQSKDCADLVRLLAYSGLRIAEAAALEWRHVNEKTLTVPGTKTASSVRELPLFPPLRALLDEMRARRGEEPQSATILRVFECKGALRTACRAVGIPTMGHHDCRHLFATRCVQLGIDFPTIAKWLGHNDGGVLAMKTYSHVTDEHADRMAAKFVIGGAA